MIFVTVGTHEQAFNRLIEMVDDLKGKKIISEEVIIQLGYSTYIPKYCKKFKFIPYNKMWEYIMNARIIITHGGPASFVMPLQIGKIPIVVPRQKIFSEHINNHQVEFAKMVSQRDKNIITVYDISDLKDILINYDEIVEAMPAEIKSNNMEFNLQFERIVGRLLK